MRTAHERPAAPSRSIALITGASAGVSPPITNRIVARNQGRAAAAPPQAPALMRQP